jgi:hypothetical protein
MSVRLGIVGLTGYSNLGENGRRTAGAAVGWTRCFYDTRLDTVPAAGIGFSGRLDGGCCGEAAERLELAHRAATRDHFARGALVAAAWLGGRAAGLYDMEQVLGLSE